MYWGIPQALSEANPTNQIKKENKKMKRTILALIIAVVVAGCNSPKKIRKPVSKVVAGKTIPRPAVQTVRGYEIISTYHVGRRIDQNDPNIMYEAGKMYVIRRSPTWNLRPNTPVASPAFKTHQRPLKTKFENMKKQQELVAERNKHIEKVGLKLLEIQKGLNETSEKKLNADSLSDIKQIKESHGQVKRKMAELD